MLDGLGQVQHGMHAGDADVDPWRIGIRCRGVKVLLGGVQVPHGCGQRGGCDKAADARRPVPLGNGTGVRRPRADRRTARPADGRRPSFPVETGPGVTSSLAATVSKDGGRVRGVSPIDNARRRLMRGFFVTFGIVLVLLAVWHHVLGVPTPGQADVATEGMPWSSIGVAGLTFIVAAGAWWLADRNNTEPNRVAGNCRECGARFEHDFCIRCGGTRTA